MLTPFGYFELVEAFAQPGCAVCTLLLREARRLLDSILYEFVTDPETHRAFRASRGLCGEHGWQLAQLGNALGIAILYRAALDEALTVLDETAPDGSPPRGLARLLFPQEGNAALVDALAPTQPCIACKLAHERETRYLTTLGELVADEKLQAAYRASDGLCLGHFRGALRRCDDPGRSRLLIGIQRDIWRRLHDELAEFVRKSDFQHADEDIGPEADSWRRAVAGLGGARGVFGVRRG